MPDDRPWKFDPFAFYFFAKLEAHLRRKAFGQLNEDLLVRSRAAAEKSRVGDNTEQTMQLRVSWACYSAFDLLLGDLEVPTSQLAPHRRPLLTITKLREATNMLAAVEQAITVDRAEHVMVDPADSRSEQQLWDEKLRRRQDGVKWLQEMASWAKLAVSESGPRVAGNVAEDFFEYLVARGENNDKLVEYAEKMAEVQHGR